MSTQSVTLDIYPIAYTLNMYKNIKCLCISSRPEPNKLLLVYIALSQVNLRKFKSSYTLPEVYNVATLLNLFKHVPYTSLTLTAHMSLKDTRHTVTYFVLEIDEWHNS